MTTVKLLQRDGRPSGKGFVQFSTHKEAVKAKEANGQDFNGRNIEVRFSSDPRPEYAPRQNFGRQGGSSEQRHTNENTIFIGGLSYQSTEDSVSDFFSQCGNITSVRLAKDQEGNLRGFAHVEFDSADAVQEALKLSQSELDGRAIRVDVAGNKGGRPSGGFQGGRGRDFGGRGSWLCLVQPLSRDAMSAFYIR